MARNALRFGWVLALSVASTSCMHGRVRQEAAPVLKCPVGDVAIADEKNQGTWTANGCGRSAICTLADVPGAEVQCSGGGLARVQAP